MKRVMRNFWLNVHLYLGLAALLPIVVIAVTGGLLAFSPQIQTWTSPGIYALEGEARMETSTVLDAITTRYPDTEIHHLSIFQEEWRPWIGYASKGSEYFRLIVDPTTARIAKVTGSGGLMETVEQLHRTLTLGTTGRYLVGASTVVLVLLLLSGLYLWLPMWKGTFRRWIRRGTALGWHNAVGVVTLPLLLIMGVTGLTLTFAPAFTETIFAVTGSPALPEPPPVTERANEETISLARAAEAAQEAYPGSVVTAIQQGGPSSSHKVHLAMPHSVNSHGWIRTWVDPYTAELLQTVDTYAHSVGSIYKQTWWQWHTGEFFGLGGRLVWALACLMMPLLAVTGAYRWWKKRTARRHRRKRRPRRDAGKEQVPTHEAPAVVAEGPPR